MVDITYDCDKFFFSTGLVDNSADGIPLVSARRHSL
jgi:hypothetical protein